MYHGKLLRYNHDSGIAGITPSPSLGRAREPRGLAVSISRDTALEAKLDGKNSRRHTVGETLTRSKRSPANGMRKMPQTG